MLCMLFTNFINNSNTNLNKKQSTAFVLKLKLKQRKTTMYLLKINNCLDS